MRRGPWLGIVTTLILATSGSAYAQTRPEPRLTFSIFAGVAGAGELWTVSRQPLPILNAPLVPADTIDLRRRFSTGLIAGLATTLFRTTHLGISGEAVYIGLPLNTECTLIAEAPDPERKNRQTCDDIRARSRTTSVVAFSLGATYRVAPRGSVSPFVRLQGGLSIRSSSVVETSGRFTSGGFQGDRVIYADPTTTRVNPTAVGAVGVMLPVSPGYQLRLEFSDHLVAMQRVTAPDLLADPPTERFFQHAPALTVSLDIVLERRRGRRF